MRAINHALTGAVIGLQLDEPGYAMPLALLSHFVQDAIPHHGPDYMTEAEKQKILRSRVFRSSLVIDAFLCVLLVVILFVSKPANWLSACVCAFLAAVPDVIWFRSFLMSAHKKKFKPNKLEIFSSKIQWYERPAGAYVEMAWFLVFGYLFYTYLI